MIEVRSVPGHATQFFVRGKSVPWYQVDLADYDCNGSCTCQDFHYRKAAAANRGSRVRCKHIEAARDFALDATIRLHVAVSGGPDEQGKVLGKRLLTAPKFRRKIAT